MGAHGGPMGPHGSLWGPMGPHGAHAGPWGATASGGGAKLANVPPLGNMLLRTEIQIILAKFPTSFQVCFWWVMISGDNDNHPVYPILLLRFAFKQAVMRLGR